MKARNHMLKVTKTDIGKFFHRDFLGAHSLPYKTLKTGKPDREILANNAIVIKAGAVYEQAKKELEEVRAIPVKAVALIRNEILDMIQEVARRNSKRLKLPIAKGRYLGKISNRATLQIKDFMENFVHKMGWISFEDMKVAKQSMEHTYDTLINERTRQAELDRVTTDYYAGQESYAELVQKLACCEVLEHNRKELDRMLENENSKNGRAATKTKKEPLTSSIGCCLS